MKAILHSSRLYRLYSSWHDTWEKLSISSPPLIRNMNISILICTPHPSKFLGLCKGGGGPGIPNIPISEDPYPNIPISWDPNPNIPDLVWLSCPEKNLMDIRSISKYHNVLLISQYPNLREAISQYPRKKWPISQLGLQHPYFSLHSNFCLSPCLHRPPPCRK